MMMMMIILLLYQARICHSYKLHAVARSLAGWIWCSNHTPTRYHLYRGHLWNAAAVPTGACVSGFWGFQIDHCGDSCSYKLHS